VTAALPPSITSEGLAALIAPGDHVHLAGSFGEPVALTRLLVEARGRFERLPVWTTQVQAGSPLAACPADGALDVRLLLSSVAAAARIAAGDWSYVPCQYPDVARFVDEGRLRCDVALVHVSPPDAEGRCSLGTTVGYQRALLRRARTVVAQVNRHMPRTHGDTLVPLERFAAVVEADTPLHETGAEPLSPAEAAQAAKISAHVAALVPDGATIEVGYGAIPDAVLGALGAHRDLGVHSGLVCDSMIDLVESGVITGAHKPLDRGLVVATTAIGTRRLYEWLNDEPRVELREAAAVCDAELMACLPDVRAINTTIEVDLSGQANSEMAGGRLLGGYGSLVELARGGRGAPGGLSILALASTDARGARSKIVPRLASPLGATLGKLDADVIVTEHGAAELRLLDARDRARALIGLADPRFRAELEDAAREAFRGLGGF
jgi:acyl-CoA hydrolase